MFRMQRDIGARITLTDLAGGTPPSATLWRFMPIQKRVDSWRRRGPPRDPGLDASPGRSGWSRKLISCFLYRKPRTSEKGRERKKERKAGRKEGRKVERRRSPRCPHSYSDCRFKCLLITRLVQQPPRSRSLCIFISTSRPGSENENVSYSFAGSEGTIPYVD